MNESQPRAPHSDVHPDAPDYSARALNPDRLRAIEEFAAPTVLDVGCGSGAYVLHFADRYSIRGVDYQSFASWEQRRELFSISDAARLEMPDDSVDTILSFETLEHLRNPAEALREYFRVCRRNVILTVPNCDLTAGMRSSGIIYNHWIDRTHLNFWDLESISSLVREAGFRIGRAELINRITLGHVFAESLGLRGALATTFARIHRYIGSRRYCMTSLLVAEKPTRKI